jgi:phytoene synthase
MPPGAPQLDADRALALTYVPAAKRAAVGALWRLDLALGAVLAGGREPLISQIKLTWWRDALEKLDTAKAPAEPVLQDVAEHVLADGVAGAELSRMEEGWEVLLSQEPLTTEELARYAAGRGALLFRHSAALLGGQLSSVMEAAGEAWALVDLARHSNPVDGAAAMAAAAERLQPLRWPARLRPLGMLAVLAARDVERGLADLEPPGAPPRMLRMLRHRFTGG